MTPKHRYRAALQERGFVADPSQAEAIELLQRLHEELVTAHERQAALLPRILRTFRGARTGVPRGLYLWGGVGRGKTWLMDSFYESLPFERKLRMHFHRFMGYLHGELAQLKDRADPLSLVADRFADQTAVLCFDEFHVADITDAMLLGRLLDALFERGVALVATSNTHPDELYRDGLQRERFLPAIASLHRHTLVFNLDGGTDYRMLYLDRARVYHWPVDSSAERALEEHFEHLAPEAGSRNVTVEIDGRRIPVVRRADSVAWFDFPALCQGPRSANDYIEIARQYQTLILGNIPRLGPEDNDAALRFITLVDELYDRNVRFLVSAAAPPEELYTGTRHRQAFQRTASRLVEMQSRDYLSRAHRPG